MSNPTTTPSTTGYAVFEVVRGKRTYKCSTSELDIAIGWVTHDLLNKFFGRNKWYRSRKKTFPTKGTVAAWYSNCSKDRCILVVETTHTETMARIVHDLVS
jgi:uncharacterized membrane protein YpjA